MDEKAQTATALVSVGPSDQLDGSLAALLMFYICLWAVKLNFLIFFQRLGYQITHFDTYWWGITIFTIIAGAACIGDIQYDCLAATVQEAGAKCSDPAVIRYQNATLKVNCALDVLTDVLIISLPVSILWQVRASFTRRLQLAGLFSLIVVTTVISIMRVAVVSSRNNLHTGDQVENTWIYLWHFVESVVASLVAYLPPVRTLSIAKPHRGWDVHHRDEEAQSGSRPQRKHMGARANYLQNSLSNTTEDGTVITKRRRRRTEYPLRETGQRIIDSRAMDRTPSQ